MKTVKIPEATIARLSVYSRYLTEVDRKEIITISSGDIAEGVGVSPAQVRKDLAYFGEFGIRGVGYNVKDLHHNIMKILGLNNEWRIALVGMGHLGVALAMYKGFYNRGFVLTGVFDNDPQKIGQMVNGLEIKRAEEMPALLKGSGTQIGVICVPASCAQETADRFVQSGVKAILNFAPCILNVPAHIELRNVDLSVNLEILTFNMGAR